ncbi:hypothetical protein FN846DRAFT_970151 [Sphaerosporella brunnea]|uniref:Uncharacterized protein n=1 Tax=Sphaerosporella brunnea TaxID=1250544 RepID=A0A5J5EHX4_9PEZI|nr:hypothetical protein FN846DRAFT_970151 [Sphaerosporella brunnea]
MRPTSWATAFVAFFMTSGTAFATAIEPKKDSHVANDFNATSINGPKWVSDVNGGYRLEFSGPPPLAKSLIIDPLTNHSQVTSYGYAKCETSWASPTYSEIAGVYEILKKNNKGMCEQTNAVGSKCKTLASYYGGQFGLCGLPTGLIPCEWLAWACNMLRDACSYDEMQRAGGTWVFSQEMRSILF